MKQNKFTIVRLIKEAERIEFMIPMLMGVPKSSAKMIRRRITYSLLYTHFLAVIKERYVGASFQNFLPPRLPDLR